MEASSSSPGNAASRPGCFSTTHWSVVISARDDDPARAREALERLCSTYWYPIYACVRHRGYSAADAEDLTQGFIASLLSQGAFERADPRRGRLRTFLSVSLAHYLQSRSEHDRRLKRGGGLTRISLDGVSAEERYRLEPVERYTPDQLFDRRWALTVIESALERLMEEVEAGGRGALFRELKDTLLGDRPGATYAEVAVRHGMSEGAVAVAVHRWRQRYRELCWGEVARTVHDPAEVESEMAHLFQVLRE